MQRTMTALAATIALSACATMGEAPSGPPDFTPIRFASTPNARLYADCIAQAVAAGRYGHAYDEVHVVGFTCEGAIAQTFFDALGPWSASQNSEVVSGSRVVRSTTRIERDLFAADYCERDGSAYRCVISLRTGEFAQP